MDLIYRSLKKKFKIVYSPEVMVFHNHGRRTEWDENKTSFGIRFRRPGAFIVKDIFGGLDFAIARNSFKGSLTWAIKTLTKGLITGEQFPYHPG